MNLRNLLDDTLDVTELKKISGRPTVFNKPVIGISRDGVINVPRTDHVKTQAEYEPIPGAAEAVAMLRSKGYRIVILSNQYGISEGKLTQLDVDMVHEKMFQIFGDAGCPSIDSVYYSTTKMKEDHYAMPNIGMFRRAENETGVKFKEGWMVGDKMSDLKAAQNVKAKPVLIKTGDYLETLKKLDSWANTELKRRVQIFDSLLDFAKSLD